MLDSRKIMNPAMQSAYRPHGQTPTRTQAPARRAATGPSGAQTAAPHPSIINQRNAHLEHQLAQRRARKPNDRNMPEGLEDITIGNGVHQYKELREVERRLDYAMMRKRLEISDSSPRMNKRQKTMRIWISNTAENQPWQEKGLDVDTFDFSTGVDGTYRVKVEGRLLDDAVGGTQSKEGSNGDEEKETTSPAVDQNARSANPEKRFSEFFKAISIDYHQFGSLTTDGPEIHWQRQPNCAEFDALEFERQGDDNINITINLTKTENPERFQLSKALADVLDTDEADRNGVVMGIWDYVRAMNLQGDEEKRAVRCDDKLRAVFGTDMIYFPQVPERIIPHLLPLSPIKLPYTIRVDAAYQQSSPRPAPTIYDILVTVDDPLQAKMTAMMTENPEYMATLRQISQLDDQLAVIIQALGHSKAKHSFYKSLQTDPVNFIKRWMSSQKRDLEVILGEATRGGGEDGSGPEFQKGGSEGVWGSQIVKEAVRYRLAKEVTPRR